MDATVVCMYVCMYVYLTEFSLPGLFRANETNYQNRLNRLRIPTGRRQTSWLCTSAAVELNQGLPETNPAGGQSRTQNQDLHISNLAP